MSLFVVVEGPDGTGKSTQARRLVGALAAAGHRATLEVEPTDGPIGRLIREATRAEFLDAACLADTRTLGLLFAADRLEHSRRVAEYLSAGIIVVCDRYALSTAVYQGAASGDPEVERWADGLSRFACPPDLTIVLEVPIDACAERLRARGRDLDMFEESAMQRRVHEAYGRANTFLWGHTVRWVNATGTEDEVASRVLAEVERALAARAR